VRVGTDVVSDCSSLMMAPVWTETCWSGFYKCNFLNNLMILYNWVHYLDNKASNNTCIFHLFTIGTPCGKPLFNSFLKSWIRSYVCVIQQRYHFLGLHSVDDRRRWAMSFVEMTAAWEIRSTRRKSSPSSTFPTTNPTCTNLELNSSHFCEWPAPSRLNHGMTGFLIIHGACYSGPKRTKTDGQQLLHNEFPYQI
jgi:hypothetical protein